MLPIKQQKKLRDAFSTLPTIERQLIALKSICCQYGSWNGPEKTFIEKIIQSGITDEAGHVLTHLMYQSMVKRFIQMGFASKQPELTIHKELHHELLVSMPETEMQWVLSMAHTLYPSTFPGFVTLHNEYTRTRGHSITHRAQLVKAIYANDSDYFLLNGSNPLYGALLLGYLRDIFCQYPVNIEWLQSRDPVIQSFIYIALLGSYYCEEKPTVSGKDVLELFCQHDIRTFNTIPCIIIVP